MTEVEGGVGSLLTSMMTFLQDHLVYFIQKMSLSIRMKEIQNSSNEEPWGPLQGESIKTFLKMSFA